MGPAEAGHCGSQACPAGTNKNHPISSAGGRLRGAVQYHGAMRLGIPSRPDDTTRDADDVQMTLLRDASIARRLRLAFGLSATAINLAKRAIARAHPTASQDELDLVFVEVHYGPDIARQLRVALAHRRETGRPR